jgi:hypothetical protein
MSTPAQILANRANAALSTGPRTAQGKAAASRNATKHGLSSAFRVLAHQAQRPLAAASSESRDSVDLPRRASPFCANGKDQQEFDQLAKSQWLLARAQRLQGVAYDLLAGVEDENNPDLAIVKAMRASNRNVIGRLEGYAASAHRPRGAAHTEAATRRTWPRPASPFCASCWRAERSFYKGYRELTKQNEANRQLTTSHWPLATDD